MTTPTPSASTTSSVSPASSAAAAAAADPLHLPHLWEFTPGVAYLNHGALGAVPTIVREERRRWQEAIDANPMGFYRRRKNAELDRARLVMARFLGSDDAGVGFVQNATSGVASALAAQHLAKGDRILVTDHVYGAVLENAKYAARRAGATVDVVPVPLDADDDEMFAAIVAGVTETTRLAIVDQISSITAKLFPVTRIVAALRERGVKVIIDGAHAPGAVPMDLGEIDADYWSGNLHKWAGAPRGAAGLYARPELREDLHAFPLSWRESEGFPNTFSFIGTADQTAWLAAPEGLRFYEELGWEAVRARNNALARRGQLILAEALGASLEGMPGERESEGARERGHERERERGHEREREHGREHGREGADAREPGADGYALPMRLVPLASIPGDDRDACIALTDRLATEYAIEVPIEAWNGRALLRLSAQLYNSEADYERLARALKALL